MANHLEIANINLFSFGDDQRNSQRITDSIRQIVEEHLVLKGGDYILIKPNLTLPWYVPGACTSKRVIESLCEVL